MRARLSEDFQVLERKPKPEKAPKAIPQECHSKTSLPLSPHPSWTVGSSQTSLQAWLFQLPSGLAGEKVGNPLFISQSVKRSTYFLSCGKPKNKHNKPSPMEVYEIGFTTPGVARTSGCQPCWWLGALSSRALPLVFKALIVS